MSRIHILPDLLVNKIAAGEVIERPASVVKELVENSLDAGATRVEIAVEQGGCKLIRIVDDGEGMTADDLARSVLPHATSKIRNEDDLYAIRTMGFRGEALPSIGAVAQLRIVSRRPDEDAGHEIAMAGPRIEPVTAAAGPPGTTVEVRELFFNVPARRKFLRTPPTEVGHVIEQTARIALAQTRVEFRLTHNGRLVHHLRPADQMRSRIADLYGHKLAGDLIDIEREERGLRLSGLVGHPSDSRSSGKWQYVFLNGRFIRDRSIAHAVREAYRGLIEHNRYPVFFLAVEIDPSSVDVNVHPTKSEVRWADSNALYSQVLSALRDRFLSANLAASYRPAGSPYDESQTDTSPDEAQRVERARQAVVDFFKQTAPPINTPPAAGGKMPPGAPGWRPPPPLLAQEAGLHGTMAADTFEDANLSTPKSTTPSSPGEPPAPAEQAEADLQQGAYRNIMQVHNAFLVAETDDGLVIVDQHALHERVLYQALSEQLGAGPLESQRLLIPETLDVRPEQMAVLESHGPILEKLGFELSAYGPNTVAAHAAPNILKPERVGEFLGDVLDQLSARDAPASTELLLDALISLMACKAAVKMGDPLAPEEIASLMARRVLVERATNCPHGRPTSLSLSLNELEKQFKRK